MIRKKRAKLYLPRDPRVRLEEVTLIRTCYYVIMLDLHGHCNLGLRHSLFKDELSAVKLISHCCASHLSLARKDAGIVIVRLLLSEADLVANRILTRFLECLKVIY